MQIVLYEPEIPPNTGNIARLCAAFHIRLNLIEPLGFSLSNRYLKRAGLDYWEHVQINVWSDWISFQNSLKSCSRLVMATTKAAQNLQNFIFHRDDYLVFGPETRGLPLSILALSGFHLRIPIYNMDESGVRSLNLSTACGIFLYVALEQCNLLPI